MNSSIRIRKNNNVYFFSQSLPFRYKFRSFLFSFYLTFLLNLSSLSFISTDDAEESPDDHSKIENKIIYSNQPSGVQQPIGFSCDFEDGLCDGWTDSDEGQFTWEVKSGTTASPYTGPEYDHTVKNETGKYLLLEASNQGFLYKAIIESPKFNVSVEQDYCLSFYYLMHGKHVFSLTIYSTIPGFRNPSRSMVFKVTGPKSIDGTDWKYAQMPVKRPNLKVDRLVQFYFDGVRGQSFYSDIAIDDVRFEPKKCEPILSKDSKDLRTTKPYTTTTTTTLATTTTTTPEPLSHEGIYLPKKYKTYKAPEVHEKYCNPGNEKYLPILPAGETTGKQNADTTKPVNNGQICCSGNIISGFRGDKCCGGKPIKSTKQLCCKINDIDTILLKKDFICCNGQKYSSKIFGCCNDQVYKLNDPESQEKISCCHFKNKRQVKYDTSKNQGCCEQANKIYNSTESFCCGNTIVMKFNKSNKCCGPKDSTGKLYMELVNECCVAPEIDEGHYLWHHYNNRKMKLFGSDKYQLYRKFSEGCCAGILYNRVEEDCIDDVVSLKKRSSGVQKGPPAWLLSMG